MLPDRLVELLVRQHGVLARWQVRDVEPDPHRRRRLYRSPELEWLSPRVARHRATVRSDECSRIAAVLDAGRGGGLAGKSAANWWGFGRYRHTWFHVALPRRPIAAAELAQVHHLRRFDPAHVVHHRDVPVLRPEVVLLWLAGMYTHRIGHDRAADVLAKVVDHAWRLGLVDGWFLHRLAGESGGRGMSGIVVMRQVLDVRPPDHLPTESGTERRFEEIVGGGVARQRVVGGEVMIGRVDFRELLMPVVHEVNSERYHCSLTDREADEARYRALVDAGFHVVVWWEFDIWRTPRVVARYVDRLRREGPGPVPRLHRPTRAPWEV